MTIESEDIKPILLNSRGTFFLWFACIVFLTPLFWNVQSTPNLVMATSLVGCLMAVFGILKMTLGRLDLNADGFTYSMPFYKKFICWGDVEDIHVFLRGRGYVREIAWSYSDSKRNEFKMDPLQFRAASFDKSIWGYWRGYEPKDVSTIMNKFRAAYRKKNSEPNPVYPVWDNGLPSTDR